MEEIPTLFCEFHGTETAVQVKLHFNFSRIIFRNIYFIKILSESLRALIIILVSRSKFELQTYKFQEQQALFREITEENSGKNWEEAVSLEARNALWKEM